MAKSTRWFEWLPWLPSKSCCINFKFFETLKGTPNTSEGFRFVAFVVLAILGGPFRPPWCLVSVLKPLMPEGLRTQSYSLSLYWSSHSICWTSAKVQKVFWVLSLIIFIIPLLHLLLSYWVWKFQVNYVGVDCFVFSFNLNVAKVGVGSLSESTAVSTSVSTCTSDSESIGVVSNLFLRILFLIWPLSVLKSGLECLVPWHLRCRDCWCS